MEAYYKQLKFVDVWEILNSNVKNEIAERVINKWNQGYAG